MIMPLRPVGSFVYAIHHASLFGSSIGGILFTEKEAKEYCQKVKDENDALPKKDRDEHLKIFYSCIPVLKL